MTQLPIPLKDSIERIGRGPLLPAEDLADLPAIKGAYLLAIAINNPITLTITTLSANQIEAGFYIYCGSARGPGGIKARLKRHFSQNKRKHWHIDHLTLQASGLWALAVPDGDECQLTSELTNSKSFTIPIKGFGASDCKTCQSHLLQWNEVPLSPRS